VCDDLDTGAAPDCADLETGTVVREGIRPRLVDESDLDQELGGGWIAVVDIADRREVALIPKVRTVLRRGVSFVKVFNTVPEGILRLGKFPGEDMVRLQGIWISQYGGVIPVRRSILRARGNRKGLPARPCSAPPKSHFSHRADDR
jgi:hypothetical protein